MTDPNFDNAQADYEDRTPEDNEYEEPLDDTDYRYENQMDRDPGWFDRD